MITPLNTRDINIAKEILVVQRPAYRAEAEIIGFDGIPQLSDTEESIMACGETFLGFRSEGRLAGAIAYTEDEEGVEICRLIVHPDYFRKGIGRRLVGFVMEEAARGKKVKVSTGAANEPAIRLYKQFGFTERERIEIAPGIFLTNMERSVPNE